MTDHDRERLEARLNERAEEIARRRRGIQRAQDGMREGELADYDQHPADAGSETLEQEIDETTDMILAEEEGQVRTALQAVADGTYGKCVDCGRQIPTERLEAIPESIRCLEDQERYEAMLRAQGPPPQDI